MDKLVDGQFQRVEKALNTLISSIATYNPNPVLANELFAADQELSSSLKILASHQRNHARLQSLRHTSDELDTQIKDNFQLLVDTRAELIATPATVFPANSIPVSYSDLLSYARRISKFTRPLTFREEDIEGEQDGAAIEKSRTGTPVVSNGVPPTQNGTDDTATPVSGQNSTALPTAISDWINPMNSAPTFVPWPTEEIIRRGALASIQILVDQGVDPATFDPERSQELEAERKRQEEELERKRDEAEVERRARMQSAAAAAAADRPSGGQAPKEKPAVFTGLDLLDDDDDEEDV